MTCDPDLVASPSVLDDPETNGQILYWRCCDLMWHLTPALQQERPRTYQAWHFAAGVLSTARA